jgi:class 3 adenylate cyclase/streptogramin lyase
MAEQGVVTIMHADVEGSTELTTRLGDEVGRRTLETTKRIVRERAETFGGRQIDAVGDAMMFTFTSTRQAIAGAIAVQRALGAGESEAPGETLRVRIGLNVGEVLERDGHPFGAAVNAGARVMAKASGGQILVSEMVQRLAGTVPGVAFRDRGRHAFKGFDERWRLYEIYWAPPGTAPKTARRRWREGAATARSSRRLRAVLAVAAVAGALVLVAAIALRRDDPVTIVVPPNSVALVNPATNRVEDFVEGLLRPGPVASGAGSIWVGNLDNRSLARIDPETRQVIETIPLPATPDGLAVGEGAVWVAHGRLGTLTRVDPQFEAVVETIPLAGRSISFPHGGVAVGLGAVWAVYGDSTLARVDPSANRKTGSGFAGVGPAAVVAEFGSVWVANAGEGNVKRFGRLTFEEGPLDEFTVGESPSALAAGEGAIWVASADGDSVTRIDPGLASTSTLPIGVGDGPRALAVGGGAVWVANTSAGTLSRIDPATRDVETIEIGNAPSGVSVSDEFVWVSVQAP